MILVLLIIIRLLYSTADSKRDQTSKNLIKNNFA